MSIGRKVVDAYIGMWVILFASGFVIFGAFVIYDCIRIALGHPTIIGAH